VLANFLLCALRKDIGHYSFIKLRIQQELYEAANKNMPRSSGSEASVPGAREHKLLGQNDEVLEGKQNTKFIRHSVHSSILAMVKLV
jgi:hypothetical protein